MGGEIVHIEGMSKLMDFLTNALYPAGLSFRMFSFLLFFFILKITVFELEFDLQDTRLGPEVT